MKKIENGLWQIDDTIMEDLGSKTKTDGTHEVRIDRAEIHMGGMPWKRARNLAIEALFDPPQLGDVVLLSAAQTSQPVTMLVIKPTGTVLVYEGKVVEYDGRLALLKKGSSRNGFWLSDLRPTAWVYGYGMQDAMLADWAAKAERVPQVAKATFDGIPEYSNDREEPLIQAVYLMDHPGFAGMKTHGTLFLATDVQSPKDGMEGIVNGYLWVPEGADLVSEHGSEYFSRLERTSGRLTEFEPGLLTFADCVKGRIPSDRALAYAAVMMKAKVAL